MSDIVIPKGDYVEIVKPICINPFGDLVKAYSIEFIKMQDRKGEIDCGVYIPDVVSWSITIADRTIEAMRGVKNA